MTEINFTSTYRIPISQAGINNAKKMKLRELVESYPNSLIGKSKSGQARVSIPNSEDANFIRKLKGIGYKIFQKIEGENISKENLDAFIKSKLDARDFNQKGKNPPKMTREMKEQRRYDRRFTPAAKKAEPVEETPLTNTARKITPIEHKQIEPKAVNSKTETKPTEIKSPEVKPKKISKKEQAKIEIRNSEKYIEYKEKYGEEFAEAVFFGR